MPDKRHQKSCAGTPDIFRHVRLVKGEEWKNIKFESEDAKLSAVLVVAKTEPEPFEDFYIRRWDHPYEPNFETKTYNLLEFCQQDKIRKYFQMGKATNLIVWTEDENSGEFCFIGAYRGIRKFRKIEGVDHGRWKPRTALMASEVYVVPFGKGIPMKDFESEFRRRKLAFPSEQKASAYQSCYGHYIIDKELTDSLMKAIMRNAVTDEVYASLAEPHTKDMLERQRELKRLRNRTVSVDRFRKRFVTKQDLKYARKIGML